jgi:hypothetical protein
MMPQQRLDVVVSGEEEMDLVSDLGWEGGIPSHPSVSFPSPESVPRPWLLTKHCKIPTS